MSTSKSEISERPRDQYEYAHPQSLQELLERADAVIAARQKAAA